MGSSLSSISAVLAQLIAFALASPDLLAMQMPREDVVDVEAIGSGLCVSNLFQSNMVLQRDKPIRIWGWAEPQEEITVSFAGQQVTGRADDSRVWTVALPPVAANSQPQALSIKGTRSNLVLENILVGDVWVLGGQSNMEFEISKVENGELEVISANYPEIRILTVPYGQGPEKVRGFSRLHEWSDWFGQHFRKGDWDICTPETVRDLSAIGYVFARRVHMASKVPVGVIDASRGGTTVESWTPLSVLQKMDSPTTRAKLAQFEEAAQQWNAAADLQGRIAQHEQWLTAR